MMKRIGDDQFSVEFELDTTTGDPDVDEWLNGYMRFVVGGMPVGDGSRNVSLNAGTVAIAELLANRGRRAHPKLIQQSAESLFRRAFSALAEDTGQSDAQVAQEWATYSRLYGIARGYEVFDDYDAFLVEDAERARYIWRHASEPMSQVHEQILRPGQFDDVLEAFLGEMRRLAPGIVK
jgi:hypothetical protein